MKCASYFVGSLIILSLKRKRVQRLLKLSKSMFGIWVLRGFKPMVLILLQCFFLTKISQVIIKTTDLNPSLNPYTKRALNLYGMVAVSYLDSFLPQLTSFICALYFIL